MTSFSSPHWLSDEQIKEIGIDNKEHYEMYRRYHYQQSFGVQQWYDKLGEFTFRSSFVPLEPEEVKALIRVNRALTRRNNCILYSANATDEEIDAIQISDTDNELLKNLENKIQQQIEALGNTGVFIKLNTRSPKDVYIYATQDLQRVTKILNMVEGFLRELNPNATSLEHQFTAAEVTLSFVRANTLAMKVNKAPDAIDLLLESNRVYQDLSRVEEFASDNVRASVVVREWNPNIVTRNHMEFRGFVYKNQLNAVSQYDDITFCPDIYSQREELGQRILDFFNNHIRDKLTDIESYVIDFFVDGDNIFVIELNPFHNGAGACLFSWREHRELFMNGPYQFKVVEAAHKNPLEQLPAFWERKLSQYVVESELPVKQIPEESVQDEERSKMFQIGSVVALVAAIGFAAYYWRNKNV